MIAIHRGEDILVEVGVNQGSIRRFNLMKEDFIQLKFSLTENMPLLVSDYIDLEELDGFGGDDTTTLFNVDRNYYPTFNKDTGGYDYNVQINAYYHQWKSKVLKYNPEKGAAESSFSLTDTIEVHAGLIISNLKRNEYTYKGRSFEVQIHGADSIYGNALSKGMKAITYSAVTIYGAMDAIAQAFECEWWVVENVIHFGYRKEDNTPIELTLNEEIADATISDSDGVHATRIYAFGGTTNVPKHYRDKLEFTASSVSGRELKDDTKPVNAGMFRNRKWESHSSVKVPVMYAEMLKKETSTYTLFDAKLLQQGYDGYISGLTVNYELPTFSDYHGSTKISYIVSADVYLMSRSWGKETIETLAYATDKKENVTIGSNITVGGTINLDGTKFKLNNNMETTFIAVKMNVLRVYSDVTGEEVEGDVKRCDIKFSTSGFSVYYRRSAFSATTSLVSNDVTHTVTINPYLLEDSDPKSSIIQLESGKSLSVGSKFTFPDIILSKVKGDYFSAEEGGVQTGVVQKNLMLPKGTDYVGTDSKDAIEAIMVFDWIYPKTTLTISNVQPFDKYPVEEDNEDGSTTTSYVTTYNITLPIKHYDNSLWVDPSQQFIIFQDGAAAGLRFEVNVESQTKETVTFQLIPNEDYVTWIPNASTIPSVGDNVILDGIDVTFIDSSVIEAAEQEVLAEANRMLSEAVKEDKVADITLSPEYALERGRIALGSQTKLIGVLGDAYDSRVLGFEECLDIPWDKPRYIIGDSNYYNRQASIETKLENIEKGSVTLSGVATGNVGGGTKINIIKTTDDTEPSDKNVLSALRTEENFLHTKEDDTVEGNITFEKTVTVRDTINTREIDATDAIIENTTINILDVREDATIGGNQTIQGTQEVGGLQTLKGGMQTELFGNVAGSITGAQLTTDGLFSAAGIIANSFKIHELIYNVIRTQGGKQVLSNAAIVESCKYKVKGITDLVDSYSGGTANIEYVLLTIKADENNKGANPFRRGDILYGYVNNIGASGEISAGGECTMNVIEEPTTEAPMVVKVSMYEVRNDIDVNNSTYYDYVSSNIAPTPSMALAQRGSTTDENRRTSIFLDAESGNIIMLHNVSTPRIKKEYYGTLNGILPTDLYNDIKAVFTGLKKKDPVMFAEYGIFRNIIQYDRQGQFIQTERNRGIWSDVAVYENNASYFDVVSYQGQLWKCVAESGSTTSTPPSSENPDWILLVSKGDDGTSIKVSGSYDSEDSLKNPDGSWKEPSDASECYIISGYLYVWIPSQGGQSGFWKNVGQFKGDRGDSVTGTTIQYAVNQSMTQRPSDGEFKDNYPSTINQGDVLWERTKVNVENHVTEWSYTASRQAKDGEHGLGIKSAMPPKYAKTSTAQQPDINSSEWKSSIAELGNLEQGSYIWTATIIDYEDENIDDTVSISVSRVGERGESITTTGMYYKTSTDGLNAPTSGWLGYIPEVNEGEYLWTRIDFSDGTSAYSVSKNGVSVKVSEIKYSTKFTASQPSDNTFTLDNPPTSIPEGGFLWSRTTFSDGNKVYSYAYQGMDNTSIQWSLLTNTNRINVSDRENASQNYIDVRVGKTTAKGYTEITDNATLSADGYKVMYYIDGAISGAKTLSLQSNEAYTFDDGTELALEENANIPLVVENSVIDLFSVRQSVTFVLVPTGVVTVTDADIEASTEVLVINSDNTLSIEMSDSFIGVQVDAEGKKTISSNTYIAEGQIKFGGKVKPLSAVSLKITSPDIYSASYNNIYEIKFAEYVEPDGVTFGVQIYIPNGSSMSSVPKYIEVEATLKADDSYKATTRVGIQGLRRGEVGKNGDQGAMVIPYGFWDKDARDVNNPSYAYRLIVSNGVVIGRPMVYHGTDCYVLQKDIEVSKNTEANLTNTTYWAMMQQFDYVFTKALMTDFANLASAIFYRRYMFSEMGINTETGESESWEGYAGDMFIEKNGQDKLEGKYVPKLFLDFINGGAKFAKLSESFIRIPVDAVMYNMDMDESHNISASRRENGLPVVVALPSSIADNAHSSWSEDGTHCTITYEYDSEYKGGAIATDFSNKVMVVCSDYRFFTNHDSKESYLNNIETIKADNNGWMIWKGQRCKFIVLSAGSILKLRSLKCEDGELYWFIENSSDFDKLDFESSKISIYRSYDNQSDGDGCYGEAYNSTEGMNMDDSMPFGVLIGSPTVNWYNYKRWILSADGKINTEDTYLLAE